MPHELPATSSDGGLHSRVARGIDKVLSVQRPVVLAHLRAIRRSRPDASPEQIIRILERRYLAAVTSGGALVGASAVIPAVGVGTSLALSGVETAGFLETSALFAQSVTELHGIAVVDPDRARTLVMTMILGQGGQELLVQFAAQASGRGTSRSLYWGELVTRNLPAPVIGLVADKLKQAFLRRFAVSQGGTIIGRAIPFGVGAVIGGTGNHLLGRKVITAARSAFGPAPADFSPDLQRFEKAPKELKKPQQAAIPAAPAEKRSLLRRKRAELESAPPSPPPPDPTTRRED